jgi:hypothetical protein
MTIPVGLVVTAPAAKTFVIFIYVLKTSRSCFAGKFLEGTAAQEGVSRHERQMEIARAFQLGKKLKMENEKSEESALRAVYWEHQRCGLIIA